MQFDKTLRTMLRTKQEGKNDSYKAGFNDALALLDQEEKHIALEGDEYVHEDIEEQHIPMTKREHLEEKMETFTQEATRALDEIKEEVLEPSFEDEGVLPRFQIEPENFSFNLQSQEQLEEFYDKDVVESSEAHVFEESEHVHQDKNSDKTQDEDVHEQQHVDVGENIALDEEELKKQRQLEALALARREAQEEEEEGDE